MYIAYSMFDDCDLPNTHDIPIFPNILACRIVVWRNTGCERNILVVMLSEQFISCIEIILQ